MNRYIHVLISLFPLFILGSSTFSQSHLDLAANLADRGTFFDQSFQKDSAAHYFILAGDEYVLAEDWESAIFEYIKAASRYQMLKDLESTEAIFPLIKEVLDSHLPTEKYYSALYHSISFGHYSNKGEAKKMKFHARKAREIILSDSSEINSDQYYQLALTSSTLGEFKDAIKYSKKVLSIVEGHEDSYALTMTFLNRRNLINIYNKKGDVQQLEAALEGMPDLALKINRSSYPSEWNNYMGILYQYKGDWQRAISYYKKASSSARVFDNISTVFEKMGELDSAKYYLEKGLHLTEGDPTAYPSRLRILIKMGSLLGKLPDVSSRQIVQLFEQAEDLGKKKELPILLASLYFKWGSYLLDQDRIEEASIFAKQSLHQYREVNIPKSSFKAASYYLLGRIALAKTQGDSARYWFAQGILSLADIDSTSLKDRFPTSSEVLDLPTYLGILEKYISSLQLTFQHSQDTAYLRRAMDLSLFAIDIHDSMQMTIKHLDSKDSWAPEIGALLSVAMDIAFELHSMTANPLHIQQAYQIMESGKNRKLLEVLQTTTARQFANLPDSILNREQHLRNDLIFYKELLLKHASEEHPDTITLNYYQEQVSQLTEAYTQYQEWLESVYPRYYQLKYNWKPYPFEDLKKDLSATGASLIEYHFGEGALYMIVIDGHHQSFHKIPWDAPQKSVLEEVLGALHFSGIPLDETAYSQGTHLLFKWLINPIFATHPLQDRLILVPDGPLGYLPFEILNREAGSPQSAYLLNLHSIHYAHTATLLLRQGQPSVAPNHFAGFAPTYEGALQLRYNQAEVHKLQQLMGGEEYLADQATEKQFRQTAEQSQILHLAMHGYPDEGNPLYSFLQFSPTHSEEDGKLHAYELYNMHLPASMVVLSACHTGYGPIAKGEGIQSLARAFAYAGSQSVVMSLWEADGSAAHELMQSFYGYLAQNYTKDEALRLAKLDFIASASPHQKHPRHWANFVVMGDASPLKEDQSDTKWWWIVLVLLGLGIISRHFWSDRSPTIQNS